MIRQSEKITGQKNAVATTNVGDIAKITATKSLAQLKLAKCKKMRHQRCIPLGFEFFEIKYFEKKG